jgi:PilZ domain
MSEQILLRPEKQTGKECRVFERQACEVTTACRPAAAFNKEAAWTATIRDVSAGGVRLVLSRRFEPGTGLAIELPGNDETYTVLAQVVNVKAAGDGRWSLGCKFVSELSEHELDRLLRVLPIEADDAGAARTGAPHANGHAQQTIGNVRLRLWLPGGAVVDCVIRRFKAAEAWPVEPGKVIAIRGGAEPWTLHVRVHGCSHRQGNWVLECEPANTPSVPQLLQALARLDGVNA